MTTDLEELKRERDNNFVKLGQWYMQNVYYERKLECLSKAQEELCNRIFRMERDYDN